jgi:hypothetical protein
VSADLGVLLPVRIETRFKHGDLWLRVIPDDPWFIRSDERIAPAELAALRRYTEVRNTRADEAVPPAEFRDLAAAVGAARAVFLIRAFAVISSDGATGEVPEPPPDRVRDEPLLPRIAGFPTELQVWVDDDTGLHDVLQLEVKPERLLANFADPDLPGDRRWWEDWDEAVATGVAGVIPAADLHGGVNALYVTGLGDSDPAELFGDLAAEGRLGLLEPGEPTNVVEGAPAAALATDPATWWAMLNGSPGEADADVAAALTGDPARLGNLPGGDRPHRAPASNLVAALWPALWGFTAGQVFDVARGSEPASWAASALFPEGAYPTLRVGPHPYGLMPVTAWGQWEAADGDPGLEMPLLQGVLTLRTRHAAAARARGTVIDKDTDGLLDRIADTPSSGRFRYRRAWPLELWWLSSAGSGLPARWRDFDHGWRVRHPLATTLGLAPLRRYGSRGPSRRIGLPLVVPTGASPDDVPDLLGALAGAARATPAAFAATGHIEQTILGGRGDSLLLRLANRSLQLLIGDLVRRRDGALAVDPEPLARDRALPGRLERLIASAGPSEPADSDVAKQLRAVQDALAALAAVPVPQLERMLRATVDCSSHRIDAWLLAIPQRRLDALSSTAVRRLGAYGWVDGSIGGNPGPTPAGLIHAPTVPAAMTAAILRDRAVSDASTRWDLEVTSRRARTVERIAAEVRTGAHLYEVLGREVERIVAHSDDVLTLRSHFPVRTEHAGRRTCNGLEVLAQQPFPVPLSSEQEANLAELREALDSYGDLLVADAVHHLVEGRPDTAGQVMDAAAGFSRPPEMALLRTARHGRAVTSSVVMIVPHVAAQPLPANEAERATLSPATLLDPSVVAAITAQAGASATWDFVVGGDHPVTVTLADLGLAPADALTLSLSSLQRLAADHAGLPGEAVIGGSGPGRYEQAAALVGLIGRTPAETRTFSENRAADSPGAAADPEIIARYSATRSVGSALAAQLRAQVQLGDGDSLGQADETTVRALVLAASRWGIAVDTRPSLAAAARLVLRQLDERIAAAPDATVAAELSRESLSTAAAALVSPTGQVGLTAAVAATELPSLTSTATLDDEWLTVVAAVRPALARLESHQLGSGHPFTAWANRAADPWQSDDGDVRPLVVAYATAGLDLAVAAPGAMVAATALERFDEVVPAPQQTTGAAFGFDAPASRAQQAILLAVPPSVTAPLDAATLAQILLETRELTHARMARPIDLDQEFWGLAPACLLPASGAIATPLEAGGPP